MAMPERKMTVNKMLSDPNPQSRAVQKLGHQGVDILNLPKNGYKAIFTCNRHTHYCMRNDNSENFKVLDRLALILGSV